MNLKPLLFLPPLVVGVVGFVWMTSRPAPDMPTLPETALAVRVQTISSHSIASEAVGYGRVTAEHSWSAIAEVQGRMVEMPIDLDVGNIVEKGQVLFGMDRTDHELARSKAAANVASVLAQIAEMTRQEENTTKLRDVEQRILEVAQAEYDRVKSLLDRGAGSVAAVDGAQKVLLAQQMSLTKTDNTLALFPAQKETLGATLALRQVELAEAERALSKTTILAPFRGRVARISGEPGQFVRVGDNLITLESTDAVEVVAELQPSAFGPLVFSLFNAETSPDVAPDIEIETSRFVDVLNEVGVTATVRLASNTEMQGWSAQIMRQRGSMDSETSAMGIVVRVSDPLVAHPALHRPPLHVGSFVEVTFQTKPSGNTLSIPRNAVHMSDQGNSFVYVANDEDRLEMHDVQLGQVLKDQVIVTKGLSDGQRLVLGSPNPPVLGMKLAPLDLSASGDK
mgnify:FL=1